MAAEILFGHTPWTSVSGTTMQMAIATEEHVGSHLPHTFEAGQQYIFEICGHPYLASGFLLTYYKIWALWPIKLMLRQAHVDHLKSYLGTQLRIARSSGC